MWHTIAVFRDGTAYQWRWFKNERGLGMEYAINALQREIKK